MLGFLYYRNYDSNGYSDPIKSSCEFHVRVYAIAEEYQIEGLKDMAKEKCRDTSWESEPDKNFGNVVRLVYESTPNTVRGLRDVIVDIASRHIQSLLAEEGTFEEALENVSGFGADMTRKMSSTYRPGKKRTFPPSFDL